MIELSAVDYIPEWIGYSGIFLAVVLLVIVEFDSIFSFIKKYIKILMICCFCISIFSSFIIGYNYSKNILNDEINKINEENNKKLIDSSKISFEKMSNQVKENTKIIEKTSIIKEKVLSKKSDDFKDYIDLINEAADE